MNNRRILIIFFVALVCSSLVHWLNHESLYQYSQQSLRDGVSVVTHDDPSYIAPVENAVLGKGWRSNAVGNAAYITRTPGYSLFYAAFRLWLPQKSALIGLLGLQFLLFAFGATLVYRMTRILFKDETWAAVISMFYAIMPMFSGFLSYTLTEGVTPTLVISFLYLVLKSSQGIKKNFWGSAIVLAALIIIRPPMIVLLLVYPIDMLCNGWKPKWEDATKAVFIALMPLLLWQMYGFRKTSELPGLHSIYHTDANDLYRPVHKELWNFHKSWGQAGEAFHSDVNGIWQAALDGTSPDVAINTLMRDLPIEVIETLGLENLKWTYESYYQVLKAQKPYYEKGDAMTGQTQLELTLCDSLKSYTASYRSANWSHTWLVVPFQVYRKLASHSNLSLYVFQKPWRGNPFVEVLRWMSFLIHLGVFFLFPVAVVWSFKNKYLFTIGLPIALYLAYLCFIQRGVEERYTLPFLLPMFLFVMVFANNLFNQIRLKNGKTY